MLRLGRLTDYGTVILAAMAKEPERLFAAAELAAASRVSVATASKILKLLSNGDVLRSVRGAKGGYRLARPAAEITLAQVIAAMEGPIGMTECSTESGLCNQEASCSMRRNWQRINQTVLQALNQVTLAEMVQPEAVSAPLLFETPTQGNPTWARKPLNSTS